MHMSRPYHPDDYSMDDFNIEDYTSQVDFGDGTGAPSEEYCEDSAGDTGEYTPVRRDEAMPDRRRSRRKTRLPLGLRVLKNVLIVLIYLLVITFVGYLLATFGWRWANDLLALDKEEIVTEVTLEEDMFTREETTDDEGNPKTIYYADLDQVSGVLQENGLIEYKWLFSLFASFTHKDTRMAPGTYELNTDMDYSALLRNMGATSAARTTVKVMIPEGYTVQEIIRLMAENGVASEADLADAAANYNYDYAFLDAATLGQANRLEGYLFPDTYEFYKDSDAATALGRMLANFQSKLDNPELIDQTLLAQAEANGYSIADLIKIASIVEKETDGVDQNSISSVIYNRLSNTSGGTNGYLQMDSTIQYILDERKETLTAEDLAIDSPYNTYLYTGLPAGPICCPGLTAIQAALNPDDTDYYYFVLGDDGSTHFFSDYNEFLNFKNAQTGVIQDGEGISNVEG